MAGEQTILDEILAQPGNREPGQPEMPTPEQVIAAENARANGEPIPGQEEPKPAAAEKKEGEEEQSELDEEVAAALEKINKGEALTDDEKASIAEMKAALGEPAEEDEDKTYTIAGKVFTKAEVIARMKGEWLKGPEGEELNPSPEKLDRMVEGYVKSRNRERQHVEVQKQSEVNAAERQALLQAKMLKQQEVDRNRAIHQKIQRELEEERARAAIDVDESKLQDENGRLDPVALVKYQQKVAAAERVVRLEREEKEVGGQIAEDGRTLFVAEVSALMAIAPQYKIEGDVRSVIKAIAEGGTVDRTAKMKLLDLEQIIMDARKKGISSEEEYELLEKRGQLAFKPTAQPAGAGKPKPIPGVKTTADSLAKMLAEYNKRKAAAPPGAGGTGAGRHADNRSDARKLVDHDRATLDGGEKDDFLDSWKTGKHVIR